MTSQVWITLVLAILTGMALSRSNMCFMHAAKSASEGKFNPLANVLLTVAAATLVFSLVGHAGWRDPAPWLWPSAMTIVGAALFGLGARINGSCTIGTMGRLAHGDLGALATFIGGGCAALLLPHAKPMGAQPVWFGSAEPVWVGAVIAIAAIGALLVFRREGHIDRVFEVVFLGGFAALLYSLRGQSSLMDAVTALIQEGRMHANIFVALGGLVVGAIGVALFTGRFQLGVRHPRRIPLEFAGGALMTAGALSIPGASDVVAFYGVPSGSPHAVIGWVVILATVVLTFRVTNSSLWSRMVGSPAGTAGA